MEQLSTKPKNCSRIHRSDVEIQEIMSEYESVKGSMSDGEFCDLYNLNESKFYSWQRKLNQRGEHRLGYFPSTHGQGGWPGLYD